MNESFGTRFARLRKENGLSQEKIAERLNISSQAVSKWENDLSCPDISALPELAEMLGVSTDFLLGKTHQKLVEMNTAKKSIDEMIFRILVDSKDGDKVKINLPLGLVRAVFDSGLPMPEVNGSDILNKINFKEIFALIEQGALGNLIDIESKDGDNVQIFVE